MRQYGLARGIAGFEVRYMLRCDHHRGVGVMCLVRDAKLHRDKLSWRRRFAEIHRCAKKTNHSIDQRRFWPFVDTAPVTPIVVDLD